jgi:hypothetical protein
MQYTPLSTIISRMDRWKTIYAIEEQFKVRDLDSAIRELKREFQPPWTLKKGSLKVFDGILEYPVASDHDEMAYIDKTNLDSYASTARLFNTSLQQFYEMVNSTRNLLSELWDNGTKKIGLNLQKENLSSKLLSQAEDNDDYTVSDDAISSALDKVNYVKGNGSIKVVITASAGTATIKNTFTAFSDSNYKDKYHFRRIYLDTVPTSIEMRLQTDDTNYLSSGAITAQFDGSAFKADQWNIIAYDLNTAAETGTFDSASTASEKVILTGAGTGVYYLDESSIKEWQLMDYWYYSNFYVKTSASNTPDQKFFYDSTDNYDTSLACALVGDDEWVDVIMYDAMLISINAEENKVLYGEIKERREKAWYSIMEQYPSMRPLITTNYWRFNNAPGVDGGFNQD